MGYFIECFDEVNSEKEEAIMDELGSPLEAATDIIKYFSGKDSSQIN
ncbi:hypothetical protein [Streptococcus dentiloxodontae]